MQAQPHETTTLPKAHWSMRLRRRSHRHEWESISAYDFTRRHLPFSFAIATVIPLVITLICREWEDLGQTLCYSYCIASVVFALLLLLRVYVLPAFTLPIVVIAFAHAAIVPLALALGAVVGAW